MQVKCHFCGKDVEEEILAPHYELAHGGFKCSRYLAFITKKVYYELDQHFRSKEAVWSNDDVRSLLRSILGKQQYGR